MPLSQEECRKVKFTPGAVDNDGEDRVTNIALLMHQQKIPNCYVLGDSEDLTTIWPRLQSTIEGGTTIGLIICKDLGRFKHSVYAHCEFDSKKDKFIITIVEYAAKGHQDNGDIMLFNKEIVGFLEKTIQHNCDIRVHVEQYQDFIKGCNELALWTAEQAAGNKGFLEEVFIAAKDIQPLTKHAITFTGLPDEYHKFKMNQAAVQKLREHYAQILGGAKRSYSPTEQYHIMQEKTAVELIQEMPEKFCLEWCEAREKIAVTIPVYTEEETKILCRLLLNAGVPKGSMQRKKRENEYHVVIHDIKADALLEYILNACKLPTLQGVLSAVALHQHTSFDTLASLELSTSRLIAELKKYVKAHKLKIQIPEADKVLIHTKSMRAMYKASGQNEGDAILLESEGIGPLEFFAMATSKTYSTDGNEINAVTNFQFDRECLGRSIMQTIERPSLIPQTRMTLFKVMQGVAASLTEHLYPVIYEQGGRVLLTREGMLVLTFPTTQVETAQKAKLTEVLEFCKQANRPGIVEGDCIVFNKSSDVLRVGPMEKEVMDIIEQSIRKHTSTTVHNHKATSVLEAPTGLTGRGP